MPSTPSRRLARVLLGALAFVAPAARADDLPLTQFVNPFIGTLKAANTLEGGNTTPAALVPFGMVQLGPDTTTAAGGYRYDHTSITGFSMTRYSGRAFRTWLDVSLLPTTGFDPSRPAPAGGWASYAQGFRHGSPDEVASPGFYHVRLGPATASPIDVDLTATARTGFARITFPAAGSASLLVKAAPSANGPEAVVAGGTSLTLDPATRSLSGSVENNGSVRYRVFFVMKTDRPWTGSGRLASDSGQAVAGWVGFDTRASRVVQVKIGISFVSVENARANLARENDPETFAAPFDFASVQAAAQAAWNARLNQVQVKGGSPDHLATFYTALYHSFIHPSVFSDAGGQYLGFDGAVHTVNPGHAAQYHNIPGWDHSRTQSAFLAFMAPDVAADVADSLANMARQDQPPACLPRWQQAARDSRGMIGDGGSIVAANIHAYDVTGYDQAVLLEAMYRGATDPNARSSGHPCREGLASYLAKGYVDMSTAGGAASITLEYAHADFAIAQFAKAVGDSAKHDELMRRSQGWKNLWKADAPAPAGVSYRGYLVPRNPDGTFVENWSAVIRGPTWDAWFREGNGSQYLWMVEHDRAALVRRLGGAAAARLRLDDHFGLPEDGDARAKVNALVDNTRHAYLGNEPEALAPHMYAWAGAPNRGAEVFRRMLVEWYPNAPEGSPANDDGGAMGSWVVMASLGLNHAIPGVGGFVIGSPRFPSATVRLPGGRQLQINAPNASDRNVYVQGLRWNGAPYDSPWLPWSTARQGGTLDFDLGPNAASAWGTDPRRAPPSFGPAPPESPP